MEENDERSVTLRYRVDRDGLQGSMVNGTGSYVAVDQHYKQPTTGHFDAPAHISHPNILQVLFFNQEDGRTDGVFEPFTMVLREFIAEDLSKMWISNDNPPARYLMLRNKLRNVFKCLFSVVDYLHSMNLSFGAVECLDLDRHFVVCGEQTVKIWKVPFTVTSHLYSRKRDFTLVANFISLILQPIAKDSMLGLLPDMFNVLYYRLTKYQGGLDDMFMVSHIALMTTSEKMIFMQNMVNKVPFLVGDRVHGFMRSELEQYRAALLDLGDNSGWLDKLTNKNCFPVVLKNLNGHFNKIYDTPFDRSDGNYKNQVNQLIASLRRGKNGVPYCDDGGGRNVYNSGQRRIEINQSLIKTVRNLATHLPESFSSNPDATMGDVVVAILSIFLREVEKFQMNLCHKGILHHFMPFGYLGEDGF